MKKLKNNKGFTLVEVIAVVIILGITLTTAIVGYNKYIEKSKKNYYTKQKDLVTQAGRDFFNDNRGRLPINIGEENCVLLSTLVNNKYIDKVLDYDKSECDANLSKVCANKVTLTQYKYTTYLKCNSMDEKEDANLPQINFKIKKNGTTTEMNFDSSVSPITGDKNKKYTAIIKLKSEGESTKDDVTLSSYDYYIHKIENNKDYIVSTVKGATIRGDKKTYDVNVELKWSGKFYIETVAYNNKGKSKTVKSGYITLKFDKIDCDSAVIFNTNGSSWINSENLTTNINIVDDSKISYYYLDLIDEKNNTSTRIGDESNDYKNIVSGSSYSKSNNVSVANNSVKEFYYKLVPYDINGNNDSCTIKSKIYKIDRIKPTCTVSLSNSNWTNKDVTVNAVCKDDDSKCVKNKDSIVLTTDYNDYYTFQVSDNAGNKNTCVTAETVKLDKTKPNGSITSTNNVATSQTATLTMSDDKILDKYYFGTSNPNTTSVTYTNITGDVKEYSTTTTISDKGTYYLSVLDKAGNKTVINKVFYKTTLTVNKGSVTPTTIITMSGKTINLPNPSSITGYSFKGWYKENSYTTKVDTSYKPTDSITLYGNVDANTYTINYNMNGGGNPTTKPTSGKYDSDVHISNPSAKTIEINIDQYFYLYSSAGIYSRKVAKTSSDTLSSGVTSNQTFKGWTSSTIGDNAKTGTSSNPNTSWDGTSTKNTYFRNLKESGTVTMIANWNTSSIKLPKIEKYGYECKYNTKSDGTGTSYDPESSYSPSVNSGSITLYPICKAKKFTVVYVANRENYLLNYTFTNKITVTGKNPDSDCNDKVYCACPEGQSNLKNVSNYLKYNQYGNDDKHAYHINEWPVYNLCTVSGYDSSHSSYKFFPHLDIDPSDSSNNVVAFKAGDTSNNANPLDFNFQLSNFFSKNKIYVLSFDIKKSAGSGNIVLKTGIRDGDEKTKYYSVLIDDEATQGTSFEVDSSTSWKTKTYIFKISDDYQYNDRFSKGYLDTGNNETDYVNSGRPELFFTYDAADPSIKGTVYIDNVRLFGADSTVLDYDSDLNVLENYSKNGYLFGGWYKDQSSALSLNHNYKISGSRINLNKNNLTCDTYSDNNSNKYDACYLYAGWYEKEYKVSLTNLPSNAKSVNNDVVKFSHVPLMKDSSDNSTIFTNGNKKFNGWESWIQKNSVTTNNDPFLFKLDSRDSHGKNKCDGIFSNSININNKPNIDSFNSTYTSCGYTDDQTMRFIVNSTIATPVYSKTGIFMGNDRYPNISTPGFGGYCQDATLQKDQEYVHVIILSMGDGLYMHYDTKNKENAEWLTSNEGAAGPRMYIYKFTPSSDQSNICTYFSQLYNGNYYLFERQHMSANLYFSGVYKVSDAESFLGQLCTDNDCSNGKDCCSQTWKATWQNRPLRFYYNVNGGSLPSGSSYKVDNYGWILKSDGTPYYDEFPYNTNVKFPAISKFGLSNPSYNQPSGKEWLAGTVTYKQNTEYPWSTLYNGSADETSYNRTDVYANWVTTDITYTITYNANGGSGAPGKQSYVYATSGSINLSSVRPTKTGAVFKGWALSSTATTAAYQPGQAWLRSNNKNYTLYAVWDDTYTITYNANSGSGAPSAQTYHYASSGTINLSTTRPTRSGYTFLGWALSASATKAAYQPGQAWSKSNARNYTLYAVWKRDNYCWKSNWQCSYYYCTVNTSYPTFVGSGGGCSTGYTFYKINTNSNSGICKCESWTCASWYDAGYYYKC